MPQKLRVNWDLTRELAGNPWTISKIKECEGKDI